MNDTSKDTKQAGNTPAQGVPQRPTVLTEEQQKDLDELKHLISQGKALVRTHESQQLKGGRAAPRPQHTRGLRVPHSEDKEPKRKLFISGATMAIIAIFLLAGSLMPVLSNKFPAGSIGNALMMGLGSGLISTAFISLILDLFWSRERAKAISDALEPVLEDFKQFIDAINKLEGRLEAFKQLGLNFCHASRNAALSRFLEYAREIIKPNSPESTSLDTIDIVSSSARGLIGYLDSKSGAVQLQWRNLIADNPNRFRFLLTHPSYSHLRQPAE